MKSNAKLMTVILDSICFLLVLLFVYAAISKMLDFENFQIQLAQSPLLSAFAGLISWGVIILELFISVLLVFKSTRILALYSAFGLMIMFTVYIYIILNYSSFIPCSCGGILEKLNWKDHLVFNIFFVVISTAAIVIIPLKSSAEEDFRKEKKRKYFYLTGSTLLAVMLMAGLFIKSENIMHYDNSFIRRYPQGTEKKYDANLQYNSFYFSGFSNSRIYLGNTSSPLLVSELDTLLRGNTRHKITVNSDLLSTAVQLKVIDSSFYLIDGNVASIFRGTISNWKAKYKWNGSIRFTQPKVIDSVHVSFRTVDKQSSQSELGILYFGNPSKVTVKHDLLQKQVDGIFDVDGRFYYDFYSRKHVYIYYYRNEFIAADQNLNLAFRSNTIDTLSPEKVKVAYVSSRGEKKFAAPPVIVNKSAAIYKNLLFINSGIIGRYEDKKMWNQASIIDVYNLNDKSYISSFYIYHIDKEKLKDFIVTDKQLYALIGTHLVSYGLSSAITKHYKK
ncbi:hypothetical protein FLACHUCJ7_01937 [Flavobacterium chungangense]|uniref:Methylamine utilisation protein MauE domain-containing protein n=2 Tax=Flavobacterium chungangense TaxID=554283 RepID=A0A6V6YYN2_9FLAO|nr:hypothetical protein FLACHUCJ7_01937 [Flavobacterium chungangense]